MENQVFALDIGTRSVTGVILEKVNAEYILKDFYMEEHQVRSMQDGQIHHVIEVANVINSVTEKLETKHGNLNKVNIAAAGRALKTVRSSSELFIDERPITDEEVIKHLELTAVQNAQSTLITNAVNSHEMFDYYCVGYSVVDYKLDENQIGSLIDQKGHVASTEVIATFLPKIVIESLLAALTRANLKMKAITLEPIAAINALVPESMRKLNVVLVDIGAGTSDIAITNYGTVTAYGMVPQAGDEITDAICEQYLLDFKTAEQFKKEIINNGKAETTDILGMKIEVSYDELASSVEKQINTLTQTIADEIIQLNIHSPKAIMLIGGGSLAPGLSANLASKLNLPANRVAIRNVHAINQLKKENSLPTGPEFVTPIGIAIASHQHPIHYVSIHVNNISIRMFQHKDLTIADALIHAGLDITAYYGRPGMGYLVYINNEKVEIPGSYGGSPQIDLNHQPAMLETIIEEGDSITLSQGLDGSPTEVTVKELAGELLTKTFFLDNEVKNYLSQYYYQ